MGDRLTERPADAIDSGSPLACSASDVQALLTEGDHSVPEDSLGGSAQLGHSAMPAGSASPLDGSVLDDCPVVPPADDRCSSGDQDDCRVAADCSVLGGWAQDDSIQDDHSSPDGSAATDDLAD